MANDRSTTRRLGIVPDVFTAMPGHWTPGRVDAVTAIARRRSTWALDRAL